MKRIRNIKLASCLALMFAAPALPALCMAQEAQAPVILDRYYELRQTDPDAAYQMLLAQYSPDGEDIRVPLELGFYQLQREDYGAALPFFEAAAGLDPSRKDVQDQLGYINVELEDHFAALTAFDNSLALDPDDETIALQRAYVLQALGRNRAAADAFYALSASDDQRISGQSCTSYRVLYDSTGRAFDTPFGETYFAPQYVSHFDLAVFPFQGRVGVVLDEESYSEAYVSLRATADTRSGRGVFGPQSYYDNAAVIAAGLRTRPIADVPLFLFVEAGGAYDLVDQGRNHWRGDARGGAVFFEAWNMAPSCRNASRGVRFVADAYGEAIYYSRYDDNVLLYARVRPGLRIAESQAAAVDFYVHAATGLDTKGIAGNDYQELGGGVAAHLFDLGGLTVRAEGMRVFRHDGLSSYSTLRVGVEHAIRF